MLPDARAGTIQPLGGWALTLAALHASVTDVTARVDRRS
jgi:hypothetical protein